MKKIVLFTILLISFYHLSSQRTGALEDKSRIYNSALELYDKELFNAAISVFQDYLPYATDPVNKSDVEYYVASCKLKLLHENAIANMKDFIERYPTSRKINNANFDIGDYYFNTGSFKKALTFYKEVEDFGLSQEDKNRLAYRRGYCYFKAKKYDEAKANFLPLTQTENKYQNDALYYYGYVCYMNKDYKQALSSFKKIEDKGYESVKLYIAEILYFQDEYQKSIDYIIGKDFKELNTNRDMLLGKNYYRLKNYEKAQEYFDKSNYNIADLSDAEAYEIGYTYYINRSCTRSAELFEKIANRGNALAQSASYNLADCYMKVDKRQNAFNAFYEAQRLNFDKNIQESSMFHYAKLAEELQYNNKAISAYQKFIELFPKSKNLNEVKRNLAELLLNSNDYKTAIEVLEDMPSKDEQTKELYQKVLFLRGQELFLQKEYSESEKKFKEAIAQRMNASTTAQCNFWLGEIEFKKDKMENARNYYQKFLETAESKKFKYYPDAIYSLGYTFFNEKKYKEAATYFERYKNQVGFTLPQDMFYDATLRLGDSYFATSQYNLALDAYSYVISNRAAGSDYAMYQQGMIYGIQNKYNNKITILKKISKDFPNSPFIPDAIFQTASVYAEQDNDVEAERNFSYLISDYPNCKYIKECYLALGQIYVRQNKTQQAIDEFKYVAKNYPGTSEARDAIRNVEVLSKKNGQVKEYLEWVKTLPNSNVTFGKEDSLYYDAAYSKYLKGDCNGATKDFEDYLKNFARGFFIYESRFYAADCYRSMKNSTKEIEHLSFISEGPNSQFKVDATARLCTIYTQQKNCETGLKYFEILELIGNNNTLIKQSLIGQVRCNNQLGNRLKAKENAEKLLKFEAISNDEKGECNNTLGKYYLHDSLYKSAKTFFYRSTKQQDVHGAEGKYYLSYILLMQDSLDKCRKSIVEFNNQYSNYDFWLDKTFLLLADYYIKKKDLFQAKATLNSIIESSQFDEIVQQAKQKLEAIEPKNQNDFKGED